MLLLLQLLLFFFSQVSAQTTGELAGFVTINNTSVVGANVALIAKADTFNTVTDSTGYYHIDQVPPAIYVLDISHIAYQPIQIDSLVITAGQLFTQHVTMTARALSLDEIVVNPGRFSVLEDDPVTPRGLTRAEIRTIPAITDDIFRTVERLPGVSGGDFLARFTVRGGDYDQVLVMLDGLELFEPFHLKDLGGGVLSIVDAEIVGGLDMMTGGFSADYGNRQSAVLEMRSRRPQVGKHVSAQASIMNARLLAEGGNERWGWLVSGRRGYTDIMVNKIDPERDFDPQYYDFFTKITYSGTNHTLGLQTLWAADSGGFTEVDGDNFESAYGNGYAWLTWQAVLGSNFVIRTLPYYGRITQDRQGTFFDVEGGADDLIDDIRTTTLYGLKSDAKWQFHNNHLFRTGFDVRQQKTDYDYHHGQQRFLTEVGAGYRTVNYDDVFVDFTADGWQRGVYVSHKWRITHRLTTDLGIRFDQHTYSNDDVISPRAGIALGLDLQTMLRIAWGHYSQAEHIGGLDVQNGVHNFQSAARATHYVAGLERQFGTGTLVRVEAYYKAYDHLWQRFENLNQNHTANPLPDVVDGWVEVYPETGVAKGIEFYVKRDTGRGLNWWASYALTSTKETFSEDVGDANFQGQTFSRAFDQTHSLSFDLIYRPVSDWFFGLAWQMRTGWPHTPFVLDNPNDASSPLGYGDLYSERYPLYHRLDVKITHWAEYDSWRLSFGLGMSNIYNRTNVRHYSYFVDQGRVRRLVEGWLPALPFFSIHAEF